MFQNSWTDKDQQVVDYLAEKFQINLNDPSVAGEVANFASIEDAASKLGKAVTRAVTERLALQQTELLGEPQPCPDCGKLCDVQRAQRNLTTADVRIDLPETACHCSACRRDFFPSTRPFGTASARV